MQKFVKQAIGIALMASAAFAHADVVSTVVQTTIGTPTRTELSAQSPFGGLTHTFFYPAATRTDASPAAAPAGEGTSPVGMLVGALAIMGIMARRRWNTRA